MARSTTAQQRTDLPTTTVRIPEKCKDLVLYIVSILRQLYASSRNADAESFIAQLEEVMFAQLDDDGKQILGQVIEEKRQLEEKRRQLEEQRRREEEERIAAEAARLAAQQNAQLEAKRLEAERLIAEERAGLEALRLEIEEKKQIPSTAEGEAASEKVKLLEEKNAQLEAEIDELKTQIEDNESALEDAAVHCESKGAIFRSPETSVLGQFISALFHWKKIAETETRERKYIQDRRDTLRNLLVETEEVKVVLEDRVKVLEAQVQNLQEEVLRLTA